MTAKVKPYNVKQSDLTPEWHVVDAEGKTLGRIATEIATLLQGKHKPTYTPHLAAGDFVIVINAGKFAVTGNKRTSKIYYRHSGYHGGLTEQTLEELLARHPTRALRQAVKGMLPKNTQGKHMLSRLKLYEGGEHPHQAQVASSRPQQAPSALKAEKPTRPAATRPDETTMPAPTDPPTGDEDSVGQMAAVSDAAHADLAAADDHSGESGDGPAESAGMQPADMAMPETDTADGDDADAAHADLAGAGDQDAEAEDASQAQVGDMTMPETDTADDDDADAAHADLAGVDDQDAEAEDSSQAQVGDTAMPETDTADDDDADQADAPATGQEGDSGKAGTPGTA